MGRTFSVALGICYGFVIDPETGEGGLTCLWRWAFGIDCPGCGLSRAWAFALRGRLHEAVAMNPLVVLVALAAARMCAIEMSQTIGQAWKGR